MTGRLMSFVNALGAAHRDSLLFLLACPALAAVPVMVELIQHIVEVHLGMYDSLAAAKAADDHPIRMAFGFAKVLSLTLAGYWVMRWLAWRDPALAGRWDRQAVGLFAGVLAYHSVMAAVQLFVLPRTGAALAGGFVVGAIFGPLLAAWGVAAPLGNPVIGPRASIRVMAPRFFWSLSFMLVSILPLMVVHYALGAAAILGPKLLLWPALVADALVVGWMAALMIVSAWLAAMRAAGLAGVALVPVAPVGARTGDALHRAA